MLVERVFFRLHRYAFMPISIQDYGHFIPNNGLIFGVLGVLPNCEFDSSIQLTAGIRIVRSYWSG
jgi:hypothetical protein